MYRLNDGKTVQFIYLWSEYYTCCKRTSRNRRILTPRDVFKRNEFLVPKRLSRNAEKYWIKWEFNFEYRKKKKVNFPLDQTTMYGDAMCEPFKMIEKLNGWKPIRTLKKTVDFALWRKKRLFCSRSDKNVMCDINNKMGENLKQNQTFSIRTLKKTLDFALWRKKIILLLLIRQQCLEMLYVTQKKLNGKTLKQNQTFSIRTLKKTVDFALWRKRWLFCSRSDNELEVWICNAWHMQNDWTIKWEKT